MHEMKRYAVVLAECPDKLLVTVRLSPAQVEVTVCHLYLIAEFKQYQHQSDAIGTAAHRHKMELARIEQFKTPYIV